MKYLENERLTELSSELSEAVLGDSHRIIQGRIEVYTMKRGGKDKKFAHALGQKYMAEIEDLQEELAATVQRRKRSHSDAALHVSASPSMFKRVKSAENTAAIANDTTRSVTPKMETTQGRPRSRSFDLTFDSASPKTAIGDFSELSTRRLMTDLILTLNSSFPDYDFSNVKPSQFHKQSIEEVQRNVYAKLSELASQKSPNWLVELWCALNDVIDVKDCVVYLFESTEIDDEAALWTFHYFFVNKTLKRIAFFTCAELIDEEEMRSEHDDEEKDEPVRYYRAEAPLVDDVDWDPSDNVAGGMSLEVSM